MIEMQEITTKQNGEIVARSGVKDGIVTVQVPHSTAGVVATSFYDPKVMEDLMVEVKRLVPSRINFRHEEAPDDAAGHIKCALFGSSVTSILKDGAFVAEDALGWFLLEYDGPRNRRFYVSVIADR